MRLADATLAQICSKTSELIYAGQYEAARDELGELWVGIGKRPTVDAPPQMRAEVLLQCGTLSGWLGSAKQLDVQEKAKDLLTEALHIFQTLNLRTKVSEAQYELGMCYFRKGAYDEAQVVLDEAMKELEDTELQAKILIRRTIIEIWLGKHHEAWDTLKEAQAFYERCSDAVKGRWHGQMALVLRRLASEEKRADYSDKAIVEYTASAYYCEKAGHERYCATILNNLAFLLYKLGRHEEAHEHLNRAQLFLEQLKDVGLLAQVEETRARVLVAEQHYHAARRVIIGVVETFEKGGESALLSDALIIKGTVQARLGDDKESLHTFRRAIRIAKNAGALSNAGRAAVSMIEEHNSRLSDAELFRVYQRADQFLSVTQDAEDIARLRVCARVVIQKLYGSELDEYFTLPETVTAYEARFVELALMEEGGSITRAAARLGVSHQTLSAMLKTRHKKLQSKRKPEIKRKSIIRKGK
jgi:tetratricopeptide (TPR) repeat protein